MDCPEPSCQTPEYPYSPGESVGPAATEALERIEDPFGYTLAKHTPGEQFGIRVAVRVFLSGAASVQERHKAAGWLERHLGESEHEVEAVVPSEFLVRAQRFLRAARIDDVLMVSVNGVSVERADDKAAPVKDNLDSMVSAGIASLSSSKRVDSLVIEAFGSNDQFEVQMQAAVQAGPPEEGPRCDAVHLGSPP